MQPPALFISHLVSVVPTSSRLQCIFAAHEILRVAVIDLIRVMHEILSGELLVLDRPHAHGSARTLSTCNVASLMAHQFFMSEQYRRAKCDRVSREL